MYEVILGALLIMFLRIIDVSLGTFRTIMVVQAKKYHAGLIGFFEVLVWLSAMKYVFANLESHINIIFYALGFALGNIVGITLEEKVALGYVQLNIISMKCTDKIADMLRTSNYGVTILPGEGGRGGVSILIVLIRRRELSKVKDLVEHNDPKAFISVQHSRPYRGFIHGGRK